MTHERCLECGFDGAGYDDASLLDALRALGPRWRALLAASGAELRARPEPSVWSAIEYAAHTRDIVALHVYGVEQALTVDEPALPAIEGDLVDSAAATYGTADPDDVGAELSTQASLLAQVADDGGSAAWSRGITIGDSRIDVRGLLEHALHDALHHVRDVERGLARLRE
jgi:hypothetical protein